MRLDSQILMRLSQCQAAVAILLNSMRRVRSNVDEEPAAGVAVTTPHFTRTRYWYSKTGQRVATLRN